LVLLRALEAVDHGAASVATLADAQPVAPLLRALAGALPGAHGLASGWLSELHVDACESNRTADVFRREVDRAPLVAARKRDVAAAHAALDAHLADVRRILGRADVQYRSVSGTEVCAVPRRHSGAEFILT
jgi:hypothetical protein